ncbi:MAG: T9SS type A sorting domain-containing protein [Phycisphaerales bacterium]|nr:T9SS type A sorting domain-containing protein [Phycisphaerales bacterium]
MRNIKFRVALFALFASSLWSYKTKAQTAPPYECLGNVHVTIPSSPLGVTGGVALPCTPVSPDYTNFYRLLENYIPQNGLEDALYVHKTVRIAIHVIMPTYPADLNYKTTDEPLIRSFMNKANGYLTNNDAPSDPITVSGRNAWVYDTRFRLDVQSIDFTAVNLTFDDVYGAVSPSSPYDVLRSAGLFNDFKNVLNVFIMYSNVNTTPGGVTFTTGYSPFIVLKNYYRDLTFRSDPERCANIFLHEMGHAFDLWHTYNLDYGRGACCPEDLDETQIDYLQDVFGSTATTKFNYRPYDNGTYPSPPFGTVGDNYTNNFMGGHPFGHYYSPMQLGRMHRNAYFGECRSVTYNTYPEDDNHDHTGQGQNHPVVINNSETWDFDIKMYNDIVVKKGATLTIKCRVMMPHLSNIIVEAGAKLIVDGGIITSDRTNDFWYGISVLGDITKSQDVAGNQGIIQTKNGATISNALHAIVAGDEIYKDGNKSGGIIQVDNTHFYNNKRSISFWKFENKAVYPAGVHKPNRSFFKASLFDLDDDYHYDDNLNPKRKPQAQMSLWDVDGVMISGCTFENKMSLAKRNRIKGTGFGIETFEANFTIANYCPTAASGPCSASTLVPSIVKGFSNGLYVEAVVSKPFTAVNTAFSFNSNGINMNGISNAKIYNNNFDVASDPLSTAAYTQGIQAYGSNAFQIENNSFAPKVLSKDLNNIGVRIIDCGSNKNKVNNNNYTALHVGNMSQGLNTNGSHLSETDNTGLQFLCNTYDNYSFTGYSSNCDEYIYGSSLVLDGIKSNQGALAEPAGNIFSDPWAVYPLGNQINIKNALPISKYYFSNLPSVSPLQQPTVYPTGAVTTYGLSLPPLCALISDGGTTTTTTTSTIGGVLSTTTYSSLSMALNDTTINREGLIIAALQGMHSAYADAELSMYYISHNYIAQGIALYNSILSNNPYQLNVKELYEFNQGSSLVQLLAAHYQNNVSMNSLSNTDIETLHYLTAHCQMWVRSKACAWLHFALGEECADVPFDLPNTAPNTQRVALEQTESSVNISPNPSNSIFTIQYNLEQDALINVTDISGRNIAEINLNHLQNSQKIDANKWQTGVYLYKVVQGGKALYNGKLIKY